MLEGEEWCTLRVHLILPTRRDSSMDRWRRLVLPAWILELGPANLYLQDAAN